MDLVDSNKCYVGSTCEPTLARRLAKHVSDYKQYLQGKGSNISSFIILKMDDYDIVLLGVTSKTNCLHMSESSGKGGIYQTYKVCYIPPSPVPPKLLYNVITYFTSNPQIRVLLFCVQFLSGYLATNYVITNN